MKIVAYTSKFNKGEVEIDESSSEHITSSDLSSLFNFLLEDFSDIERNIKAIKIVWNIDEFAAPILRLLGEIKCRELATKRQTHYQHYLIFYIPGKILSLSLSKEVRSQLYGIEQYFQEIPIPPDDVYSVKALGDKLMETLAVMNLYPTKLTSPASIYTECILEHANIPSMSENKKVSLSAKAQHKEALAYALKCCSRLWISNYQVGHWLDNEAWDYDLSSAFSSETMKLYSTNMENCQYEKSSRIIESADWGYLHGAINIIQDYSPIMRLNYQSELENPIGFWDGYITLDELRFIEANNIGTFKLEDGWFLTFKGKMPVFGNLLQRLYSYRGRDQLTDGLSKRMMNCVYGVTLRQDSDGKLGKYYNPFYAAQITTNNRLNVARFIYKNELQTSLICVNIDGVQCEKQVSNKALGKGVGKWKLNDTSATIVVSPGLVFRSDRRPHGINYETLVGMIKEHPQSSYYSVELPKRVTLGEALNTNFNEIGKIKKFHSSIDLNLTKLEQDRVFKKYPEAGMQLLKNKYRSEPKRI
jgi:hypothetical protein